MRAEELAGTEDRMAGSFRGIRAAEPVKSFFFNPADRVATFPEKYEPPEPGKRILLGLKACDLAALRVHDRMFGSGDFADPFYGGWRKKTILVAADCPEPARSCFCNLVGGKPYAEGDCDVIVSASENAYLLESVTPEGAELLALGARVSQPATAAALAKREEERDRAVKVLAEQNGPAWRADLAGTLEVRAKDRRFWLDAARDCVECFGCLMGCPTCYCYLLYDRAEARGGFCRTRVWDACYMAAYQRVGGGANPRSDFLTRFVNRFQCKFQHFRAAHGMYACSGCGRCLSTCMGRIDIRKVLGAL
jgi:hypothetical protein